ncbi:MAG: GDP-mannose 4,6-dehydratase [Deltaproteobacteria bacterium]|nr:GDP-mannose 4,6-dehydratase [Deltaproteobacteria bacterium]
MRLLVTGACGFIGSHVCEALVARGDTVVGLDNFNDFYDPRLKEHNRAALEARPGFSLVRGSILDEEAMAQAFVARPDAVVHLAAWAGVRPSIERPALYVRENVDGTVAVMDALRAQPRVAGALPKLVFASSSSVYGTNAKVPFEEDDPIAHPVSPYAATKRAAELLAYTYHHLYGLDVTCLRFFTVYGPRQRPEMAIHKFARLLLDGKAVPRYGDGTTRRDYTFIADIVQGVLASIDRCAGFHIYNLGNSRTVTLNELIEKLATALGVTAKVEALPEQPGDVPITYADVSRAVRELDYRPDFPLERGLAEFATWLKARG